MSIKWMTICCKMLREMPFFSFIYWNFRTVNYWTALVINSHRAYVYEKKLIILHFILLVCIHLSQILSFQHQKSLYRKSLVHIYFFRNRNRMLHCELSPNGVTFRPKDYLLESSKHFSSLYGRSVLEKYFLLKWLMIYYFCTRSNTLLTFLCIIITLIPFILYIGLFKLSASSDLPHLVAKIEGALVHVIGNIEKYFLTI